MAVVKKNTLGRYMDKLFKYKSKINQSEIVDIVGEIGTETALNQYGGNTVNVSAISGNNGVEIVAKGEQLAYMEFGTGISGKGTYQGDLPTETLEFESRGRAQSTKGWQYNYYKEQNKDKNPNTPDFKGRRAGAQMFNTARQLEKELPSKIKNKIKGD